MPTLPEGNTLLTWQVPEYQKYQRGKIWYASFVILGLALIVYAVATLNFLFALIVLICALVIVMSTLREPGTLEVRATETGLAVGSRFMPYRSMAHFAIVYDPPVKNLYLEFKDGFFNAHTSIALEDENPIEIRNLLIGARVKENLDHSDEPFFDLLGRILKL